MPFIPAALWPVLISGGLGVASSVANRPRTNRREQLFRQQLQQQLQGKLGQAPAGPDPRELAAMLDEIAMLGTGARERIGKGFASRGLAQSGLLGEQLGGLETTILPRLQSQAFLGARGLAQTRQQREIANLLSALGLTPPQERQPGAFAAGTQGLFESLMWLLGMGALGAKK